MAQRAVIQTSLDSQVVAVARDVADGLARSPKELPCRYFYDAAGCELFDAITHLPEYYLTRAETEILSCAAREIVGQNAPEYIVELGAGFGAKTRLLLDAASAQGGLRGYVPFDISGSSLRQVAADLTLAYPGLVVHPVQGDFASSLDGLSRLGRQLVLFLGSTIGNFTSSESTLLFRRVRALLAPDDAFLIGFDLVKDERRLIAAYDDGQGVTARFNLNLLVRLNRELGANFDVGAFQHVALYNRALHQIEIYLRSLADQVVKIPGAAIQVAFRRNEVIHTEIARKFTPASIDALLRSADMRSLAEYRDSEKRFMTVLAIPA